MSHLTQINLARSKRRKDTASILIVEDEPSIIDPLALSLERENYDVLIAEDGLSACRMIGEERPDLIILDILLPDFNGWEVCRMLRQHPISRIATTPVIMLTALTSPEDKIRGLELGADFFLPKPFSIRELQLLSAKLIERRQHSILLEQNLQNITRQQEERINFTHLLFHELRNQLAIIGGYTQLLSSGHKTDSYKDVILKSSDYLNSLAEDMLLIRQVQDGGFRLNRESLIIKDVLQEMVEVYATQAREKGVNFNLLCDDDGQALLLNRPALKVILSTLIDNALKYGPAGQTVTIDCCQAMDLAVIKVIDRGEQIPTEERVRIFEPFYRAKTFAKQIRGSGLGLHGVRVLSRAMGGNVTLEDIKG
ncbi:MAG: response regulator, partial [Deltaproteobacteria bacterium]|nr:response regulator [Deltaproteobacteria bacterium]